MAKQVGQFELLEELFASYFGSLWKANDTKSGEAVVVRVVDTSKLDEPDVDRISQAACGVMGLEHERIVTIHDVVMEGGDLAPASAAIVRSAFGARPSRWRW
jgi:hypothetical protein